MKKLLLIALAALALALSASSTAMIPTDPGGGAGLCEWWQVGWTVYKSPGYMYVFQPDGSYRLVFRYGYATCGYLASVGHEAWVGT